MASVRPHTVASDQPLAFMPPLAVYNLDEADVEGQRKRFDLYDEVRHYSAAAWPPCCLTALPPCCCGALLTGTVLLNQAWQRRMLLPSAVGPPMPISRGRLAICFVCGITTPCCCMPAASLLAWHVELLPAACCWAPHAGGAPHAGQAPAGARL